MFDTQCFACLKCVPVSYFRGAKSWKCSPNIYLNPIQIKLYLNNKYSLFKSNATKGCTDAHRLAPYDQPKLSNILCRRYICRSYRVAVGASCNEAGIYKAALHALNILSLCQPICLHSFHNIWLWLSSQNHMCNAFVHILYSPGHFVG